jgi:hypothetical protein
MIDNLRFRGSRLKGSGLKLCPNQKFLPYQPDASGRLSVLLESAAIYLSITSFVGRRWTVTVLPPVALRKKP